MEKLFGKVWIVIIVAIYLYFWTKVIEEIKTIARLYKPMKIYRHLETSTKLWILIHLAILFLWSYSVWEG